MHLPRTFSRLTNFGSEPFKIFFSRRYPSLASNLQSDIVFYLPLALSACFWWQHLVGSVKPGDLCYH